MKEPNTNFKDDSLKSKQKLNLQLEEHQEVSQHNEEKKQKKRRKKKLSWNYYLSFKMIFHSKE